MFSALVECLSLKIRKIMKMKMKRYEQSHKNAVALCIVMHAGHGAFILLPNPGYHDEVTRHVSLLSFWK